MLNTRKFPLEVFSDHSDINIVVSVADVRERVAKVDICEEVKVLVKLMVVVELGIDSALGHHHTQKDASVFMKQVSLGDVLKREVGDDIELDWNIGCFEDFDNAI